MEQDAELKPKRAECVECGAAFHISVGEQRFFARKGLAEPKRCLRCRKIKAEIERVKREMPRG